jgi:hypothetical protein
MDSLPFYLLLVVALLDILIAAWFIGQGLRAGADSPQGRPRLLIGGTMITGAILIAGLAFFLFGPFG